MPALAKNFIGVSPITGQSLQGNFATFAAAGTTASDATSLTTSICHVTSGTGGVKLSTGIIGDEQLVFNESGSAITVYPPTSSTINQLGTNTGMTLPNNTSCRYTTCSATQVFALMSA